MNATHVYWISGPNVMSIAKDSLTGEATTNPLNDDGMVNLVVDETTAFWTTYGGSVNSAPLAGGPILTIAGGQKSPGQLAVDAASVYWSDYNRVRRATIAGSICDNGSCR